MAGQSRRRSLRWADRRAVARPTSSFPRWARRFTPSAFLARPHGVTHEQALILGVPWRGPVMEDALDIFRAAGLAMGKPATRAAIAARLRGCRTSPWSFCRRARSPGTCRRGASIGVTGEDLVREQIPDVDERLSLLLKLGFGHANVIVAVPDVGSCGDHGRSGGGGRTFHRRTRTPAGVQPNTHADPSLFRSPRRRALSHRGEPRRHGGRACDGAAEAIVDITSTGATLQANGLRILRDGLILQSGANLVATTAAAQSAKPQSSARKS